eukprot:1557523-Pyramimonas_sp.AAC.1
MVESPAFQKCKELAKSQLQKQAGAPQSPPPPQAPGQAPGPVAPSDGEGARAGDDDVDMEELGEDAVTFLLAASRKEGGDHDQ